MTWGFKSEGNRTVIVQDGVTRVAINEDGSMELLTPAANPTGNKVPTAGQLGFGKMYESPEQTITAGSVTLAHGLGTTPKLFQVILVCKTAEHGYAVNDIVPISTNAQDAVGGYGVSIRPDATNLTCKYGSAGFLVLNASTGVAAAATNANWRLIVRAWA